MFFVFFASKNALKYIFYSVFEQPKFAPKMVWKNDNFSHFSKTQVIKNVLLQPPSWRKFVFLLKIWQTLMLNKNKT